MNTPNYCPRCGAPLGHEPGNFCKQCGAPINAPAQSRSDPYRPAAGSKRRSGFYDPQQGVPQQPVPAVYNYPSAPKPKKYRSRAFLVMVVLVVTIVVIAYAANPGSNTSAPPSTPAPTSAPVTKVVQAAVISTSTPQDSRRPASSATVRPSATPQPTETPTYGTPRAILEMTAMAQTQPDGYDAISDKAERLKNETATEPPLPRLGYHIL